MSLCFPRHAFYVPHSNEGIVSAQSSGDGYSIALTWERAYPDSLGFQVSYNIYFSTIREDVFTEGPKYLSIPPDLLTTTITNFTPGDTYFFAVKATEFDSTVVDLSLLPDSGTSKIYPEGMLLTPMTSTSTTINLSDIEDFPPFGIIQVGVELIRYTNKDQVNDLLLGLTRGYYNSSIREHEIDGYDGVRAEDPIIRFWRGFEDPNEAVSLERSYFAYPNFPYTTTDGYKVDPDLLTTDLHGSDEAQADFGSFPLGGGFSQFHPADILSGKCLGLYIGGEQGCADGYNVGQRIRGLSVQDANNQREQLLLETDGESCILVKRRWTGIRCACYMNETEYPDDRCFKCFTPDTLIKTDLGWRKISEIKVGEKVLSEDGEYRAVTKVYENDYSGMLQAITSTVNGRPILTTPDHPFLVLRGAHNPQIGCGPKCNQFISNNNNQYIYYNRISIKENGLWEAKIAVTNNEKFNLGLFESENKALQAIDKFKEIPEIKYCHILRWDDAKNVNAGDWLVPRWYKEIKDLKKIEIPQEFRKNTHLGSERIGINEFPVDEEFMWMVGLYLAEGSGGKREIYFCLHINETEYQNRIVNYFRKYGYNPVIYFEPEHNSAKVCVCSTTLAAWFKNMFGTKCYDKKIPEIFMKLPANKAWSLIDGVWCGDGSKRDKEINQTSEILALQLVELLHRVGEQPLLRTSQCKQLTPKGNKRKLCYTLNWAVDNTAKTNRRGRWNFENEILSRVRKVEQIPYIGKVYNLEVEENHTYVVQGIVVHNCGGGGIIFSYEQYVNPRRSDGRILVRFEATEDDLVMQDAGLESTFPASAWTLSVPAIKDRDFLIRFKDNENFTVTGLEAGTEEFRYEVLSVTRNKIFNNFLGRQQLKLQRVRKTDPIAHVPIQKTIGTMPRTISTSIASSAGIPPHTHTLVVNENIVAISQINGLTSVSQNHNHEVFKGEVLDQDLGHHHILLFP